MASKIFNFQKEERLCSKKLLDELFKNGSSFLLYPFRVTWLLSTNNDQKFPAQVVVGVPKKRFKHSVDRNHIKRRIKEAYRLNKEIYFYQNLNQNSIKIILAINYVGKEAHDYAFIEKKMKLVFAENLKQISK
ncbi:ribonuclease P protein component [Pedobacter alpinus]|uniref:Ribonuclease P protein component n=1 Tax=Pedobacter alpinus TaxID=1590643 RepID=A0ABW5TMP9_9SPHI